jgi:hypothetical protein
MWASTNYQGNIVNVNGLDSVSSLHKIDVYGFTSCVFNAWHNVLFFVIIYTFADACKQTLHLGTSITFVCVKLRYLTLMVVCTQARNTIIKE